MVGHVTGILCTGSRGHLARVHSIAIARAERRGGIGRRLLQYFLSEAAARGRTEVLLEVAPSRRGARRLFEGLGFRVEERLPDYYGARKDGLSMRAGTGAG